ncbi:albumin [Choloepus didactylus]|uniref:albumin n=1 Tax=Choloepus didactylus TaxID=27675 RepID=UPI00189F1811|nr:albumin [Choloepus didactylus]
MKWVTFISLLFLFSSAYSRGMVRREADKSEIAHRFKDLGEENFRGLALATFSQYLQKNSFDDLVKLVTEVTELAKTCVADEAAENCGKSLHTLLGDKACSVGSLRELYGELADCCGKQEPERNQCFLKHKDDNPDLPPFARPEVAVICASFQENEEKFLGHYLYEISRRNPFFYAPELIHYTHRYKDALKECCSAEDKAACLAPKLEKLKEKVLFSAAKQRLKCSNLEKFGERPFKAWAVATITQSFSHADFAEITKLVTDYTKINQECCQGDLLKCADDREDLVKYICENQGSISNKLKQCCDKPLLEKSHCILEIEKDDLIADLPALTTDFADDKEVCKHYAEAKDVFLGTFLYELSRRHLDFPITLLLRLAKIYEAKLEKCCATADPHACYSKVFDEFQPIIDEPKNLVKHNCELFEQHGDYGFTNLLLIRYTKKFPEVSAPTLVDISRRLGKTGTRCCKKPESERLSCVEEYLNLILNRLCVLHEKTPVSEQVTKCCTESLVNRRPCFSALPPKEDYVPKEFNLATFTFHADICELSEEEKQIKKQVVLVEVLKHKPKATDEQLKTVKEKVTGFLDKCCHAVNKEACFTAEGTTFTDEIRALLV